MPKIQTRERFLLFGRVPERDLTVVRRLTDENFSRDLAEVAGNDNRYTDVLWVDRLRGIARIFRGRVDPFMETLYQQVPEVDTWDLMS